MARLNVNPTRMALSEVGKRLRTAVRGHKLLKDKRDELVRRLLETAEEVVKLREITDEAIVHSKEKLRISAAIMGEKQLETALLLPNGNGKIGVEIKKVMGASVPKFNIDEEEELRSPFGFGDSAELEEAVMELAAIKGKLIRLAELEKTAALLSREAERAGRRVNALEYVLIPSYRETIHYIKMKLDENERANSIRLLKVKDMVLEQKKEKM